ncbi:MAG: hypothetical protein U0T02_06135 [Solirubrobacteraceae bacterium]
MTFRRLEILSFVASGVYAALLWCWLTGTAPGAKLVLGWTHGCLWILMTALVLVAARRRILPLWLAVLVAVVGGLGPFAGSIGFIVEDRRRHRSRAGETAPAPGS